MDLIAFGFCMNFGILRVFGFLGFGLSISLGLIDLGGMLSLSLLGWCTSVLCVLQICVWLFIMDSLFVFEFGVVGFSLGY